MVNELTLVDKVSGLLCLPLNAEENLSFVKKEHNILSIVPASQANTKHTILVFFIYSWLVHEKEGGGGGVRLQFMGESSLLPCETATKQNLFHLPQTPASGGRKAKG